MTTRRGSSFLNRKLFIHFLNSFSCRGCQWVMCRDRMHLMLSYAIVQRCSYILMSFELEIFQFEIENDVSNTADLTYGHLPGKKIKLELMNERRSLSTQRNYLCRYFQHFRLSSLENELVLSLIKYLRCKADLFQSRTWVIAVFSATERDFLCEFLFNGRRSR